MEFNLPNPGLVENDSDGTSCFLACIQMIMRRKNGGEVYSFKKLSEIIRRKEGEYSWEYGMLAKLADMNFSVKFISTFDLKRFCEDTIPYMYEYFGDEAAKDQIENSNMNNAVEDSRLFLGNKNSDIDRRIPEREDITSLIKNGYYLIPYVNQKIFQADPGYVAHTVLLYGFSDRGVRMHNPGPPATEASEIAWDLFEKAWSSPSRDSRILMAIKP